MISGLHPVGMCHENHVRCPLGRPSGLLHQVIIGITRHQRIWITGVVAELVEVSIRLVRDALAVTIDIDSSKSRGLDRVAAEFPNGIEGFVRGLKAGGLIIPGRGEGGIALNVFCEKFTLPSFDFYPAKWQHYTPFFRRENGGR